MTEEQIPEGADYTLRVPLKRDKSKIATFYIREMQEDVFIGAKAMIDKGRDNDAVRMMLKALWVGGDSVDVLKDNFIAIQSATKLVMELVAPVEGELKKN